MTSLKELLHQDINILYDRFTSLKLDQEERSWHLKRYFSQLNTSNPEILPQLKEVLNECIESSSNDQSHEIYAQFLQETESRLS